ncbi:IS630 transposase-related protein [Wolbachia endosymbiont of Frankliniella intonsa]|uniref:IS630 transposase-related protein n=1 Tax=Wolbachia endosymbiont of Frankliniella intonsa TaxID=2902422 RepID=UPI00244EE32E|nr:IS630 transposase-related protein [Wolbachia endosymbiont of Frankliniella intonsa]WGJ61992.1 IS630 transposase-related protein [Wolbachia endosymbiont of Frankliniella intonsa]WGJ62554.1 IS630 transposase-related protein [Wolbachia endosymbiont of Frankliniella intonsa]WGJ62689.1 IS630 transposase-related protein [Wolbachia endosymbiont of Frankliniella intonsa]
MAYSVDLREKAVLMIEKGKTKVEIAELMEIGIATLYRWLKKKAAGESLKPSKNGSFIRKIDPKILEEYVTKNPDHTLAEMKQNLGFGINSIWYRLKQLKITLKKSHYIKSAIKKIGSNLLIKSQNRTFQHLIYR